MFGKLLGIKKDVRRSKSLIVRELLNKSSTFFKVQHLSKLGLGTSRGAKQPRALIKWRTILVLRQSLSLK